jgi:hypothetical protein
MLNQMRVKFYSSFTIHAGLEDGHRGALRQKLYEGDVGPQLPDLKTLLNNVPCIKNVEFQRFRA